MRSGGLSVETSYHAAANTAESLAERLARETQDLGGLELIGVGELQDGREENAIDFELGLGVQVRARRFQASADEVSEGGPTVLRRNGPRGFCVGFRRAQECRDKHRAG